MKISKLRLEHQRNEAHYQFMLLLKKLFTKNPDVAAIVDAVLDAFYDLITLEGQLVDAAKYSDYTEMLAEADKRVDRDIAGITAIVEAGLLHFDPRYVEAAKKISNRLKSFKGEIEKKPYEEESAAVKILLADMKNHYMEQIAILNLGIWLDDLMASQANFENLFIQRNTEWANRPKEKLREVRKEVDAKYHNIVERIDAYGIMNGYATTGAFVDELNREVKYFNDHVPHHTKKDIDLATVASIPDQIYADEPAVPMPDATYEGEKLIFARDYELSYHDNASPGTALVTLHGKGEFKGKKQVSFNIIKAE
ncbi:MAG: DUF6261 family protein [Dysgonamonadaceae bacterium]|jgi:hypothetical protein|nr:DUF6261 family protein [Dysgonamonadaceae bacterium]